MGMNTKQMMKCGHSANANRIHKDGTKTPSCAICAGITPDAEIVVDAPDLEGRKARCSYFGTSHGSTTCHGEVASSPNAAFFEHRPGAEFDRFYCGCWGWD